MSVGEPSKSFISARGMRDLSAHIDSDQLSVETYRASGVFVLRDAISSGWIAAWSEAWREFHAEQLAVGRNVNVFNPVVVNETIPAALSTIHSCPDLLDTMEQIYPDLALYTQRFLLKNADTPSPVFLHHDFGYDSGWPEKTAVFVPLSPMNADNGGLVLYPGTHALGYLGDVGEFDTAILDPHWPTVCPVVEPGDVVLVHECTWHASLPYRAGPDRVLAQITYQPASDPSSAALMRGEWRTEIRYGDSQKPFFHEDFFARSRTTRLRELQSEVEQLRQDTVTNDD